MSHSKVLVVAIVLSITAIPIIFYKNLIQAWMRFALRNEYIVVSLTTTPYRIYQSRPVIDFILAEKVPLKAIYLNVPHRFKRDNLEYKIPQWLQDNKRVTILRTEDYGPATKLLGSLEQAKLPANAIIITVDDDVVYPKNLLLYLAYRAHKSPDKAIGLSGMNPHYNKHGQIITDGPGIGLKANFTNDASVAILEGFGGIAYRRKFFDNSIFEIVNAPRECVNSDDLYLSFYLAKHNIERKVLRDPNMSLDYITWNQIVGFDVDALHRLSPTPAKRHRTCIAYMKQQDPKVIF